MAAGGAYGSTQRGQSEVGSVGKSHFHVFVLMRHNEKAMPTLSGRFTFCDSITSIFGRGREGGIFEHIQGSTRSKTMQSKGQIIQSCYPL